jgi:hypothetical protein
VEHHVGNSAEFMEKGVLFLLIFVGAVPEWEKGSPFWTEVEQEV